MWEGRTAGRCAVHGIALALASLLFAAAAARADDWFGPELAIPGGGGAISAAMAPDGGALAVGDLGATLTTAVRMPSGGWSAPQALALPPGDLEIVDSAMGDGGGAIVAASTLGSGSSHASPRVFVRDPDSSSFSSPALPAGTANADALGFRVAMTAGGAALLTWEQDRTVVSGSTQGIEQVVFAASRVPGGAWTALGQVGTSPLLTLPTVAAETASATWLAFGTTSMPGATQTPKIVVRRLLANGTLGPARGVAVGAASASDQIKAEPVAAAIAPDGSVEVAYTLRDVDPQQLLTGTLRVARFAADGSASNSSVLDTESEQLGSGVAGQLVSGGSIAFDGAGASSVAWDKGSGNSSEQVKVATRPGPGQPFSPAQTMYSSQTAGADEPAVESLGDGRVMLVGGALAGPGASIRRAGQSVFGPLSAAVGIGVFDARITGDGIGRVMLLYSNGTAVEAELFDRNVGPPSPTSLTPTPSAPGLRRLTIRPRRVVAKARVSWTLTAAGSTTFQVQRVRSGVLSHGRCRPGRHRSRHVRRCARYQTVERLVRAHATAGANHLVLRVRHHGRRLAVGRYRLTAQTHGSGVTGRQHVVAFRVVPQRGRADR